MKAKKIQKRIRVVLLLAAVVTALLLANSAKEELQTPTTATIEVK